MNEKNERERDGKTKIKERELVRKQRQKFTYNNILKYMLSNFCLMGSFGRQ